MLRLIMSFLLIALLSGCSSTNYQASINRLQMQVGQLESDVQQRDTQISSLRYDVDRLSQELRKKQQPLVKKQMIDEVKDDKKEGIIRVSAATDQIQAALKKAGYYKDTVDGKIGQNTKGAIMAFQKDHDLKADGIVGKKTWDMLKTYLE